MDDTTDLNDPRLIPFKSLKQGLSPAGHFIIESQKVVEKALNTNQKILSIVGTQKFLESITAPNIEKICLQKHDLEKLVGFNLHHGILALVKTPKTYLANELKGPILALNGITSNENMGAILRSALALNFSEILIDQKSCNPFNRRSSRVSMGNIFNAKICLTENLVQDLKALNLPIIVTSLKKHSCLLHEFSFPDKFVLVIGSEGDGIDSSVQEAADHSLYIPMHNEAGALNAACAATTFMYQATLK